MYPGLKLDDIRSDVATVVHPFFEEILMGYGGRIDSLYVVGSALAPDYDPKTSDINTIVCMKKMVLEVLDFIAGLGPRFGKERVRAPLIMTPWYIGKSHDAFPIELLDVQSQHVTCYGEDRFAGVDISPHHIRLECERELKSILTRLRQEYLAAAGRAEAIHALLQQSLGPLGPLSRAILSLTGDAPAGPQAKEALVDALAQHLKVDAAPARDTLSLRRSKEVPTLDFLVELFRRLYTFIDTLADRVDEMPVPEIGASEPAS